MEKNINLRLWTKQVLRQYNLRAGQRKGQHFLVDGEVLFAILKTAELTKQDKVLEVGGGIGVLTTALLDHCGLVVSVEVDKILVAGLKKLIPISSHLKVLPFDILKIFDDQLLRELNLKPGEQFSIVSNLPYDISGIFLRRFLSTSLPIKQLVLLLQKEVAERLTAPPGSLSLIGILAQLECRAGIIRQISHTSFYPPPRVESCLVKLVPYSLEEKQKKLVGVNKDWLWQLARIGFSARRKQLKNNLLSALSISPATLAAVFNRLQLNPKVRAQELTVEQWVELAKMLIPKNGKD
ncbi:MAG: 16S rRNA (adenine(1518)-N(6)/adenine(1519)-N(6))-dimethyltransferase RsmA [Patescibacteria group bacterium]